MTKSEMKKQAEQMRIQAVELMGLVAANLPDRRPYHKLMAMADSLCQEFSAVPFCEMLMAEGGYRPTIRSDMDPRGAVLADLYDFFQARRGDERRAYRG
jgi:hypothetical protein